MEPGVKIVPIRQEQLKERLGERFRELDVPLLVEWPDGRPALRTMARQRQSGGSAELAQYALAQVFESGDNERQRYKQEYQLESSEMAGFAERFTNIGLEKGLEKGREEGRRQEAIAMLTRFLTKRFGPLDEVTRERLQKAEVEQIEAWSDRVLDAQSIEEVFESA